MIHAFAPAAGDPPNKRPDSSNFVQAVFNAHPSNFRTGTIRAYFQTRITLDTNRRIPINVILLDLQGPHWTGGHASFAVSTEMNGFRIMAKSAMKRTGLKEKTHPISWTIHIGKRNDPINRCSHRFQFLASMLV